MDIGSSFLPSELTAAFLWAQLEELENIQNKRKEIWENYWTGLQPLTEFGVQLPFVPEYATNNGHMFYFVCNSEEERSGLIDYLNSHNINAVFHYLSLHKSPYFESKYFGQDLIESDRYSSCLLRLPFYYELSLDDQKMVINTIIKFYNR